MRISAALGGLILLSGIQVCAVQANQSHPALCRYPVASLLARLNARSSNVVVVAVDCKVVNGKTRWVVEATAPTGYFTTGKFFRNPIETTTYDGASGTRVAIIIRKHVVQPRMPTHIQPKPMGTQPPHSLQPGSTSAHKPVTLPGNATQALGNFIAIGRAIDETRYARDSASEAHVVFARLMTHGAFDAQYGQGFDYQPADRLYWVVEWYYPGGLTNPEVGRYQWAATVQSVDAQTGRLGLYSLSGKVIQRFGPPPPSTKH